MKKILIKEYTQGEIKTIKAFQDWMDSNHPNWVGCTDSACTNGKNLNKGKGYGTFGPSTTKAWSKWGNDFNAQYNPQSDGGGAAQQSETEDYPKIIIYSRLFKFFTDNGPFYLNSQDEYFKDILERTNDKKMIGYNLPTAFIKSVVETNPQIIKVSVPERINNDNVELQFEFFKRIKGLQTILEQLQTPAKYITYNIVDGLLKKQTEYDNYKNAEGKKIRTIIGGGDEVIRGEKSDTVARIKKALGYTKDSTPYFTDDFDEFIIDYKGKNGLDNTNGNTNGNISKELICSIEQYKKLCSTSSSQKTTAPPTNTKTSKPIELKYLNDYANAVGTGIPDYATCKSLFDYYSEQALIYRRLNKANQKPNITAEDLKPIQDKILRCQKSSDLKDRAKLDTLISQRFRIQQDKDSPYYLDI